MEALIEACRQAGFWKLVSRVFVENQPSRALLKSLGFREVGIYERHGRLDGEWRDVVIVERQVRTIHEGPDVRPSGFHSGPILGLRSGLARATS